MLPGNTIEKDDTVHTSKNADRILTKPFDTYNGGKESSGTYQQIINLMPPHDTYIEGFLGNGTVMRYKMPARINIGIDIDTAVINEWKKNETVGYNFINDDMISMLYRKPFNMELGASNTLIYLDPPYPKESRKSDKDLYPHEMTIEDHKDLLFGIVTLHESIKVMISSYPNELYESFLSRWNKHTFQAQTRQGPATEIIYYNFEKPEKLHDYSYIGKDYREREKFKGVRSRTVSKFHRMPAVLRNSIIKELINL